MNCACFYGLGGEEVRYLKAVLAGVDLSRDKVYPTKRRTFQILRAHIEIIDNSRSVTSMTMDDSREMSPLSSQLSSHGSSEFGDDIKVEDRDHSPEALPDDETHLMPPTKRRRTGQYSHQSTPAPLHEPEDLGEISSDTEGSVPASPIGDRVLGFPDDDPAVPPEQVTVCKWKDCSRADCGDMDTLVQHIHDDHIGKNKKRYACEWEGCNKKESTVPNAHASGYALKAHMRSHTKEKPFYCRLPGTSTQKTVAPPS